MTNTLHRQGSIESLKGDYIIFATAATGYNRKGSAPKKKAFLEMCMKYGPVNISRRLLEHKKANFLVELFRERSQPRFYRDGRPTPELLKRWWEIIEATEDDTIALAVFDSVDKLREVVKEVKAADLGLCINITALHEDTDRVLREAGIIRHTIEHSLGFHGRTDLLPPRPILEISTMCGHGMVGFNLVRRMLDEVKLGRITPQRAAEYLMKPCWCGAFNPVRAASLLQHYRDKV
jgi:hypothetical protein